MDFYIKKNATLPILKMAFIKDGRSDFKSLMEDIESYAIYFSMFEVKSGIAKIMASAADIVSVVDEQYNNIEYYIYYKFTEKDTNVSGRYKGEFLLKSTEGDLILPLREELYINVLESGIREKKCC